MCISIQLITPLHTLKVVDTSALVDSSADISCIDWQFIWKNQLSTEKLASPIAVHNIDQTANKTSAIHYTCTLYTNIEGIAQKHLFYVMGCGRENVILGTPWLCTMNPSINWAKQTLTISESCNQLKDLYSIHAMDTQRHHSFFRKPLPRTHKYVNVDTVYDSRLYDYLDHDTEDQYVQSSLRNHLINWIVQGDCKWFLPNSPMVTKLITTTKLAIATEKTKPRVILPSEYANFAQVFSKEAIDHVPPSRPYNHEINLDESFMPKIGKIYPLSPDKKKATVMLGPG